MPTHDWKRVGAGPYHHFHQSWTCELCNSLNAGTLPDNFYALIDQRAIGVEPDVLAMKRGPSMRPVKNGRPGLAVAEAPPKARFIAQATDQDIYAARANRIAVRNADGELVALVEIVSPGNKSSREAFHTFVKKAVRFLQRGVNLLIVDPFPPTKRDPQGIHKAIWDQLSEEPFELPADKPMTVAAYQAEPERTAYVEPVAVGDELPSLPLFLEGDRYVPTPLEASYMTTWSKCPAPFREAVEAGLTSS